MIPASGAILTALLIAWLTPVGPWLWKVAFPPPELTATSSFVFGGCGSWVVPPGGSASTSDADFATPAWAAEHRAAEAEPSIPGYGASRIFVSVRGYEARPVTITGISFSVHDIADRPLAGDGLDIPCGGPTVARYAEVDLDARPPAITASSGEVTAWGPSLRTTPLQFPYEVTDEDTELLHLVAYTSGYVEWSAELAWTDGEESGRLVVDNQGDPFRTSAPPTPPG